MRGIVLSDPLEGWASSTFEDLLAGGHAAVFGSHRVPMAAEDAGFEIRDCLTVLGPEPARVWLLRKPVAEKTIVAQVLRTGTGALWIDGCRVGTGGDKGIWPVTEREGRSSLTASKDGSLSKPVETDLTKGRWPTNLVLEHRATCEERRLEHETLWSCTLGCVAAVLNEQSGVTRSAVRLGGEGQALDPNLKWRFRRASGGFTDQGGASRFYPQFRDRPELVSWLENLLLGPTR